MNKYPRGGGGELEVAFLLHALFGFASMDRLAGSFGGKPSELANEGKVRDTGNFRPQSGQSGKVDLLGRTTCSA
jgi:hypothetical protein